MNLNLHLNLNLTTILAVILFSNLSLLQIVYTSSDHYVYEFLERLSLKNVIEYHNEVKPISRKHIAELLSEASLKKEELSAIELKELDWLFEEYACRLNDVYYNWSNQIREPFLLSPLRKESRFSFEASYEILHDLFAEAYYSYSDITEEDSVRTPEFLLGKKHSFSLSLHYGL